MFVDLKMSLIDCNLYEEEVGVVHLAVTNSCRGRGGVRRKIQIEWWCNETEVCFERKWNYSVGWMVIGVFSGGPFCTIDGRFEVHNHRDCDCWTICLNFGSAAENREEERDEDLI